jgi:hypothetical protein
MERDLKDCEPIEGADPEEESFDHVPNPAEVRFPVYSRLFDVSHSQHD